MVAKKPHPLKRTHHLTVIPGMICAVILGLMVLWYGAMLIANIATQDEPIPDTSDLVLPTLDVAATNGYPALEAALLTHPITATDTATIQSLNLTHDWTAAAVSTLVSTYDADLNALATASTAPVLQDPKFLDQRSTEMSLPSYYNQTMQDIRTLTELMLIDAHRQAAGNNYSSALTETIAVANVGQRLANSRNLLLIQYFGYQFLLNGLTSFQEIAAQAKLGLTDLQGFTAQLPDGDTRTGLIQAELVEYNGNNIALNGYPISNLISGAMIGINLSPAWYYPASFTWAIMAATGSTNFIYLPDQTARLQADVVRAGIQEASLPCDQIHYIDPTKNRPTVSSPLTTKNILGQSMVDNHRQGLENISQARCNVQTYVALIRTDIALQAYEQQTGSLPTSLTTLVPSYLSSIPLDPYSGQPVKYDVIKHLVYSVGIKHIDHVGTPKPTYWNQDLNPTVDTISTAILTPTTSNSAFSNLYYVAVGDNGKSGQTIGCGDSLVAVQRSLGQAADFTQNASVVLTALLSDHSATIGDSGLQNALADSRLTVSSVTFNNATSKMDIKLLGTVTSGGTCQDARIKAQLSETMKPYEGADGITITINNQPLDTVLSGKGQ